MMRREGPLPAKGNVRSAEFRMLNHTEQNFLQLLSMCSLDMKIDIEEIEV